MNVTSVNINRGLTVASSSVNYHINQTIELTNNNIVIGTNTIKAIRIKAKNTPIKHLDVLQYPNVTVNYIINSNEVITWEYLVMNWSVEPTLNTAITAGDVYDYTLNGTTRYRFVPTNYNPTQDAFYANFDGTNLNNLITTRG